MSGAAAGPGAAVNRLVTFAHVVDVEASLAFYALLGFRPVSTLKDHAGRAFWARCATAAAGGGGGGGVVGVGAEIMFARASGPIDAAQQAVLFYMYSPDVASLRAHLLRAGLHDGGPFTGQPGPNNGLRTAFAITRPDYMPAGEFRVSDPDGYVILIGQLG